MRRMRRAGALATVAVAVLALAGCAFGPDPRETYERTGAVFDDLVAELGATDEAVLRTVEVVPTEHEACGDDEESQAAMLARGALSVRAEDGAVGSILTRLSDTLDGDFDPVATDGEGQRAWSSEDGITVVLTDATPIVVVAVFGPCLPPVAVAAG